MKNSIKTIQFLTLLVLLTLIIGCQEQSVNLTGGSLNFDPELNHKEPVVALDSHGVVVQVANGGSHTCARESDGLVSCWGLNRYGQMGIGTAHTNLSIREQVQGLIALQTGDLGAGANHTCVVQGLSVMCWGDNQYGQLGDGTTTQRNLPTLVNGVANGIIKLAVGYNHTCALSFMGTVQCWGNNFVGQLGNNSGIDFSLVPVAVSNLTNIKSIVA